MNRFRPAPAVMTAIASATILFSLARPSDAPACTTAVIAGSATADGRPLLWKNRDADDKMNQVIHDASGRFAFVGIVNGGDAAGFDVWAGINARGFAIMNSASYNLDRGETTAEGRLMRMALQSCATVAEFQALLDRTAVGGRDVNANFGVIDAQGGAALFEVSRKRYVRYDATDRAAAPGGFIVRTNYSDSGDPAEGSGMLRRQRATALLADEVRRGSLSARSLLARVARDVANLHIGWQPGSTSPAPFAYSGDSICRFDTSSAALFVGTRPGEDPLLATAWFLVGQPVTGIAVPVWVRAGEVPTEVAASPKPSAMTAVFNAVRTIFYPETRGELKKYVRVDAFANGSGAPLPRLLTVESEAFALAEQALAAWASSPPSPEAVAALQREIAARVLTGARAVAPMPQPPR